MRDFGRHLAHAAQAGACVSSEGTAAPRRVRRWRSLVLARALACALLIAAAPCTASSARAEDVDASVATSASETPERATDDEVAAAEAAQPESPDTSAEAQDPQAPANEPTAPDTGVNASLDPAMRDAGDEHEATPALALRAAIDLARRRPALAVACALGAIAIVLAFALAARAVCAYRARPYALRRRRRHYVS